MKVQCLRVNGGLDFLYTHIGFPFVFHWPFVCEVGFD